MRLKVRKKNYFGKMSLKIINKINNQQKKITIMMMMMKLKEKLVEMIQLEILKK